jgi:hypothetical protein
MFIGLDKDGFPKAFSHLKSLIDSGKLNEIKFCLTLLGISRTLTPKKDEDIPVKLNTITDPGPDKRYTIPRGFIKKFVMDFNLKSKIPKADFSDVYLSTKTGPIGKATAGSLNTILFLSYPQMQIILDFGTLKFQEYFQKIYNWA